MSDEDEIHYLQGDIYLQLETINNVLENIAQEIPFVIAKQLIDSVNQIYADAELLRGYVNSPWKLNTDIIDRLRAYEPKYGYMEDEEITKIFLKDKIDTLSKRLSTLENPH